MDSGSTLYIPVQEQASGELDSYYNMPELFFGTRAKDSDSSSDDMSSDDSSSITSVHNNDPAAISAESPQRQEVSLLRHTCLLVLCA